MNLRVYTIKNIFLYEIKNISYLIINFFFVNLITVYNRCLLNFKF